MSRPATLKEVKAAKPWECISCGRNIEKGEKYWSLTAFRRSAHFCGDHKPSPETVKHFAPQSRADRASDVSCDLRALVEGYEEVADQIEAYLDGIEAEGLEGAEDLLVGIRADFDALGEPDLSDIDSLAEEMDSWRSSMDGSGLENTPKYSEVEAAADILQDISTDIALPTWPEEQTPENLRDLVTELRIVSEELERVAYDLDSVEFPGMY